MDFKKDFTRVLGKGDAMLIRHMIFYESLFDIALQV